MFSSLIQTTKLVKSVLTGSNYVVSCALRIVYVRKLTALKSEGRRVNFVVALVEVGVFLIFQKVSDQKLSTVPELRSTQTFDSPRALSTVAALEEAAIGCWSRSFNRGVTDEVNWVRQAIIPAHMSINISLIKHLLVSFVRVSPARKDRSYAFFSQKHVSMVKRESATVYFFFIDCKALTFFVLRGDFFICANLFPKAEEIVRLVSATWRHRVCQFHCSRRPRTIHR